MKDADSAWPHQQPGDEEAGRQDEASAAERNDAQDDQHGSGGEEEPIHVEKVTRNGFMGNGYATP
jgi:hypothetical protein